MAGSASTLALPATGLAESRTSLSEWQTDPELKFYGRAMRYRNSLLYGIVMAGCGRLPAS